MTVYGRYAREKDEGSIYIQYNIATSIAVTRVQYGSMFSLRYHHHHCVLTFLSDD